MIRSPSSVLVVVTVLLLAPSARAQDTAAVTSPVTPSASPETDPVLALVQKDKLRAALELASRGTTRRSRLVQAVLRAACLTLDGDRKDDDAAARRQLLQAGEQALPEDVPFLRELAASSARAAPYARVLVREACAKIDASSDRHVLLAFLRGDDETAKRRALAAIGERLARIRSQVDSGGDLDGAEQGELADRSLIDALVGELGERQAAADALAHDLAASSTPSPLHALALIEAPAIPALEAARRRGAPGAEDALRAVREAARERLRRNPHSTWASARGAMPQVVPDALSCTGCKKPLPEGAHFCPSCGASSPGTPCARCGQTSLGEICSRCGGLTAAKATARTCEKGAEPVGTGDRFCRRCGVALPGAQK